MGFSLGPPFQSSPGSQLTSLSGSISLTRASVGGDSIVLQTSQGAGGAITATLAAYLVTSTDVGTFFLRSASDPGVSLSAQVGNAAPQEVDQTRTPFAWEPG